MKILDIIKDNIVEFHYLRRSVAYYKVKYQNEYYVFPVPLEDVGDATLLSSDKALIMMRYIRKAIETNQFQKIN